MNISQYSFLFFEYFSPGSPEPNVTWYKDGSVIPKDTRIKVEQDHDANTLIIENGKGEGSGQYTAKVENDKGSSSYTVSVSIGPEKETVVQEVVTVHKVSEKAEVLEETINELGASTTLEAKETAEANLKEKLEEAEKLIVVDNKMQQEDTGKKEKKKEVHKVEEKVLEGGQVVREISDTVSSSGVDVGLTEDSLHKLEPFVMMENRVQKGKKTDEESDEEIEEIVKIQREVKIISQV